MQRILLWLNDKRTAGVEAAKHVTAKYILIDFAILALAHALQLAYFEYSPDQLAGPPRFIVVPPKLDLDVDPSRPAS